MFGKEPLVFTKNWGAELYARARDCEAPVLIKTHEFPFDESPCIYLSRDGRDACASLARFWTMPLREVILGVNSMEKPIDFGTWSTHYHAWNPQKRKNCLIVRFEDILQKSDEIARQLSEFLKLPIKGKFVDKFDEHKEKWPRMYDDKNDELRNEIQGEDLDLFWRVNGQVMTELGY